jgi:hypothetical protein
VSRLGPERPLGHDLVVHVQPGRAVGLVAVADPLLDELDPEDAVARLQLAVGDQLLLGRDPDEVVDVPELAVLDEQGMAAEAGPWARITPWASGSASWTSARILWEHPRMLAAENSGTSRVPG